MKKQFTPILQGVLCLLLLTGAGKSYGQILSYTSSTTGALNSVATHATGTALVRVNGANAPGSPCGTGFSSTNFSSTTTYSTSLAAIETSVTPGSGYALSVTSFSVDLRRSSTGPASVRFAYSTDGGTTWTNQGSNQAPDNASCGTAATGTWTTTVSVNAPATLKFRVYGFNASGTTGTFQILNLTINGTVTSPCTAPTLSTSVTNVSCNGGNNGGITLTTTGGTSPFTYSWSNGATTQNISSLIANTYSVTVTATGGCTANTSATVTQPAALAASISAQTNTGCGGTDAAATVSASGGTTAYTYSWNTSPVQTTATATGLSVASYTATVTDAHGCTAHATAAITVLTLSGLSASAITASSATLNWGDAYFSASYNIHYRQTGTTTWSNTTSTVTNIPVSGLSAATTYEFQVQAVCTGGATSSYSASTNFTTAGGTGCGVPTGLSATSVGSATATLNWTAVSGAVSYNIQYRKTGTTTWSSTTSSASPKSLTGLASSTAYEFQVQTVCSGSSSAFSSSANFTTTSASACDSTLWTHVYNSYRLIVNQQCIAITGTVAHKINEADGDIHIRVTVDSEFSYMINASNVSGQYGDLVVEPVCAVTVTQSDAVASCTGFSNTVYIPNVGEHVQVVGSYVTDNNHGWNEIHPVTSITIVSGRPSNPANVEEAMTLNADMVKVYPNPANNSLHFILEKKPSSVVFITIVDGIGRLAGQYQMLETRDLSVNTTYLPSGKYFYSVVQDNNVVKGGTVIVKH